jgi:hypothetical protein
MRDKPVPFESSQIGLDLSRTPSQGLGHLLEAIPTGPSAASPPHQTFIEAFLTFGEVSLACDNIGRIKAAGTAPRIELVAGLALRPTLAYTWIEHLDSPF